MDGTLPSESVLLAKPGVTPIVPVPTFVSNVHKQISLDIRRLYWNTRSFRLTARDCTAACDTPHRVDCVDYNNNLRAKLHSRSVFGFASRRNQLRRELSTIASARRREHSSTEPSL